MIAYFDCFSGISGDMTLGAFLDLGISLDWLKKELCQLISQEFDISVETVIRHGICAKQVRVDVRDSAKSRHFTDIVSLIQGSPLSQAVKKRSVAMFDRIADAESHIHGSLKETVHFHEVGGIDAIVDIVGVCLCLEYLGVETVIASKIPMGKGFVRCQHGRLPVPAPATVEILKGVPVCGTEIPHELVTPTGAAIITTLAASYGSIPDIIVEKIGYGAGTHVLEDRPNVLRIMIGTPPVSFTGVEEQQMIMIETCIDDMNPEFYGFLMDRLFADGALDVYWTPVFMKKNRPATMINVLCRKERKNSIIKRILSESTSLGVRFYDVGRNILPRESIQIFTSLGPARVKKVVDPDGEVRFVPEYEACKAIAMEKNIPLRVVYDTILFEARRDNPWKEQVLDKKTGEL
ncbi:MAG: nickel pincer cofactor biosynthesis protein LarC [Deltaproteobacteria bacterium]|nr:nickel pincer cofactor biosynthesis protein LarC [Deltaproteobacteria bacterium]MBW1962819.1 nickel pincer cofactor biosynthesis protein LarC [Deltaproteobacteria bacterium]MBW1995217.1 nickel pincer cofactor biosynthesis protein LarC [Deltaproteobacteria bacterium]MBW2151596.1 nickel pincer cofactor biosynthesis protein LarC [Deltaproteobacteria bacterium]